MCAAVVGADEPYALSTARVPPSGDGEPIWSSSRPPARTPGDQPKNDERTQHEHEEQTGGAEAALNICRITALEGLIYEERQRVHRVACRVQVQILRIPVRDQQRSRFSRSSCDRKDERGREPWGCGRQHDLPDRAPLCCAKRDTRFSKTTWNHSKSKLRGSRDDGQHRDRKRDCRS